MNMLPDDFFIENILSKMPNLEYVNFAEELIALRVSPEVLGDVRPWMQKLTQLRN
jgi:hypothetical protein